MWLGRVNMNAQKYFKIFDSTLFTGVPQLPGMEKLPLVDSANLLTEGKVDISKIQIEVDKAHGLLCIDDEASPTDTLYEIIASVHHYDSGQRGGFYGRFPERDYWDVQSGNTYAWHLRNGYSRYTRLSSGKFDSFGPSDEVDVVFPSIYTFYDDHAGWFKYAEANIAEAHRYGKPVFPFIMMFYHDSNPTIGGKPIPGEQFLDYLKICHRYANGVVIWGGWQIPWDTNAAWYQATQKFMGKL